VTLLLATTSVYARMSGGNEVIALKAQGISPWAVIWPSVMVAFCLSLVTVWLTDTAVSWGRAGAQRVVVESVVEIAYSVLRTDTSYSTDSFSVRVKGVEGDRLIRPTVSIKSRGKTPAITLNAAEAKLTCDRDESVLKIVLRDGHIDFEGEGAYRFPNETFEMEIPLDKASNVEDRSRVPSNIALARLPGEKANQLALMDDYRREMAVRGAFEMLCGDFEQLTSKEWLTRHQHLEWVGGRLYRLETEPHRRWSAGFSCFCFLWVGAPMAILLRNRDFLTSFFLCFMPILAVYYPVMMYGIDGAKNGTVPPYSVWAGNLILLTWGGYLLRKVIRY